MQEPTNEEQIGWLHNIRRQVRRADEMRVRLKNSLSDMSKLGDLVRSKIDEVDEIIREYTEYEDRGDN